MSNQNNTDLNKSLLLDLYDLDIFFEVTTENGFMSRENIICINDTIYKEELPKIQKVLKNHKYKLNSQGIIIYLLGEEK